MNDGLFPVSEVAYPPDTLCDADSCGHRLDQHQDGRCSGCMVNLNRGFSVTPVHEFKARILAGGARNADEERRAYEQSLKVREA